MKKLVRALRLPFITASVLPFIFGSFVNTQQFNLTTFILGLLAVAATHLSANLINDYADAKSGADWQDKRFFGFFGGSKLIQEGVLSEKFYFSLGLFFAFIAATCVILLTVFLKTFLALGLFLGIILLSWAYSTRPLQLSYRRIGELVIFLLFGPALVMGGYFLQTGIFPDLKSFLLSFPFGFFTTAILFSNEIPDFSEDKKAGKFTWVSITGVKQAYLFYVFLIACGFAAIILNFSFGYLRPVGLLALIFIPPAIKAARILQQYPQDKIRLMESSKITIGIQAMVSIALIISLWR